MEKHYVFSAPGRTEISGNHTDHQCGCVLAAAVNLETVADVRLNGANNIWVQSEGYPTIKVNLDDLSVHEEEKNTTAALIRGVASSFVQRGAKLEGFDAVVNSTVLPGSGLSSSAAFEVLFGTILNELFFDKKLTAVEIAQIGQYAENVYFGKEVLRQIPEEDFLAALPKLRNHVSDRAILRAIHVYRENKRVEVQAAALRNEDLYAFFHLVRQSGHSSWMYLQNIYPSGSIMKQEVALALALCDTLLQGKGAYRVHGGGFAGTVQAFVPFDLLPKFKEGIENVLGEGKCHVLNIRNDGGIRIQ